VKQGVRDGWPLDALMRTGMHPEIHDALNQIAREGNPSAVERLRVLREHVGWDIGLLERIERPGSNGESKPYTGDVTSFAPENLGGLLDSLST
ncbi:hypothetical protein, partial [Pseudomonas viridiflava]